MAKGKRRTRGLPPAQSRPKKPITKQRPPRLIWRQEPNGQWVPLIVVGDIVMPGAERPFMGFWKGEREAMLVWTKQMLSELLFDCPKFITDPTGKIVRENPDWLLLPYYEEDPTTPNAYVKVEPKPSIEQVLAGEKLPVSGS